MPVKMVGAAAGKMTKNALRNGLTSSVAATFSHSRLTADTPKAVLINIGQTEQKDRQKDEQRDQIRLEVQ